ncbi:MAG: hypothetical protein CMH59_10855 [Myxococcales bacterium]|nr:hypothetical protein [Myxococcales bacterium]
MPSSTIQSATSVRTPAPSSSVTRTATSTSSPGLASAGASTATSKRPTSGATRSSATPKRRSGAFRSCSSPGSPVRPRTSATETNTFGTIASVSGTRITCPPASTERRSVRSTPACSTAINASASSKGDSKASSAVSPTAQRARLGVTAIGAPGGSRSGASSGPAT